MSIPESVPSSAAPPRASPRAGLVLFFLCAAGFMTFLDISIVNVALPTIETELGIPETYLQYVVTAYGTVLGGFLMLGGRLADTFGRRRMLQLGLLLFALASLVAGLAQGSAMLIAARGLQGLGSAFIAPAALSLLTSNFAEGAERNRALGAWGAISGLAAIVGVMLGGVFTETIGWRWIFFVNIPIGIILAVIGPRIVAESRADTRRKSFDVAGATTLTALLLLLIFTLGQTVDYGWLSAQTVISFVVIIALVVAFLMIERRASEPLVPLSIFKLPVLRTANALAILLFGTLVTLFFFASLFMQQVLDYTPIQTGLAYLPIAIATAIGAGISSNLVTKLPAKPILVVGLLMAAVGLVLLRLTPADGNYFVSILPAFVIAGLGLGASFVPLQIAAFSGVPKASSGLAAGLINTSQEAGGALGLAVAATIVFRNVRDIEDLVRGDAAATLGARVDIFHEAFVVGACFAVAAVVLALLLPTMRTSERPEGATAA